MITADTLAARRDAIAASADLTALRDRLLARAEPVLARMPIVPDVKALLSRDGGTCPDDGTTLLFDPWSPDAHRCARCGRTFSGERHHAYWARAQHLWVGERAAHLATLFAVTGDGRMAARARQLLAAYHDRYFTIPNRDNVLGPSHLFFSTYLESIWILNYLAAAHLLRTTGALNAGEIAAVDAIADEAATLIGEFNEGMSNRQTWHAAAMTALGVWFDDEELVRTAVESRTGLLGHLADGFGSDGMWFEGENYHLFALRGLLIGLDWAHAAGAELLDDPQIATHLGAALMAPSLTALPDFTFPARKDARYGVSLAHPAYLECWEAGFASLGAHRPAHLADWLHALYATPATVEGTYDSYLHEAGEAPAAHRGRPDLSWWALWTMAPALPGATTAWTPRSRLLDEQGLAILRRGDCYVGLECTGGGGGHGHPDRLHLTVHAGGVHWLPDPGTGSYVSRDLFWYRSTLAHNAPRVDGIDQPPGTPAHCLAFDTGAEWQWAVGQWGEVTRTVMAGPRWIVDVVTLTGPVERILDLPWHLNGGITIASDGSWTPREAVGDFTHDTEGFSAAARGPVLVTARHGDASLGVWLSGHDMLLRARGPGLPGSAGDAVFLMQRVTNRTARMVAVIDLAGGVDRVDVTADSIIVHEATGETTVRPTADDATITASGVAVTLGGARAIPRVMGPILRERPMRAQGDAIWVNSPPALDGSFKGFDRSAPLTLDDEHQYFRSEEPYGGPEQVSAVAYVNWDQDGFYLGVHVTKPEVIFRPPDAAPLLLDNEPDDIHADGVQVYYQLPGDHPVGWLVRPGPDGGLLARSIDASMESVLQVSGRWRRSDQGYRLTMMLPCPGLHLRHDAGPVRFDLIVNEMRSDRVRRAGQLVWSGGPGWVYLRGDRQDPEQFGELELIG